MRNLNSKNNILENQRFSKMQFGIIQKFYEKLIKAYNPYPTERQYLIICLKIGIKLFDVFK
jgi:hypothetical protein